MFVFMLHECCSTCLSENYQTNLEINTLRYNLHFFSMFIVSLLKWYHLEHLAKFSCEEQRFCTVSRAEGAVRETHFINFYILIVSVSSLFYFSPEIILLWFTVDKSPLEICIRIECNLFDNYILSYISNPHRLL